MYEIPNKTDSQSELITSGAELRRFVGLAPDDQPCPNTNSESQQPATPNDEPRLLNTVEARRLAENQWPVRVCRHFASRIEPNNPDDPLLKQILPSELEQVKLMHFTRNPLKEQETACQNLLTKYQSRVLFLATPYCGGACRFCFRRFYRHNNNNHSNICGQQNDCASSCSTIEHLIKPIEFVRTHTDVKEVILSGGDPLMLDNLQLSQLIDRLNLCGHLHRLRIHTRMPIFYPPRIDEQLLKLLANVRQQVYIVIHINHPQEIDAEVEATFSRLRTTGAILLQQGVLLKGINDRVEVLRTLYERLADNGVVPYYLHQLDRVEGAAHFEVEESVGRALIQQVRDSISGYAVPTYVREIPDAPAKTPL